MIKNINDIVLRNNNYDILYWVGEINKINGYVIPLEVSILEIDSKQADIYVESTGEIVLNVPLKELFETKQEANEFIRESKEKISNILRNESSIKNLFDMAIGEIEVPYKKIFTKKGFFHLVKNELSRRESTAEG